MTLVASIATTTTTADRAAAACACSAVMMMDSRRTGIYPPSGVLCPGDMDFPIGSWLLVELIDWLRAFVQSFAAAHDTRNDIHSLYSYEN